MIFEQINKYPEPASHTYFGTNVSTEKSDAEKAKWAELVKKQLEDTQKILAVGDIVYTKAPTHHKLQITSFLTEPEKIFPYKDEPCFIMAVNPAFNTTSSTRYALHELDLDTIIKADKNV